MGGGEFSEQKALIEQVPQQDMRTVSGTVYGADGETLPGASILVKGISKYACLTDADGKFTLSLPKNAKTLTVSFVGYKAQDIRLSTRNTYAIYLESATDLQEVVVTGIVTKRKDTFTGSSATFSGEELKAVGVQNPIASLRSLDPSFNVLENTAFGSDPNHLPNIEIRGKSSMLGLRDEVAEDPNQPLFILDGFESYLQTM